MALYKKQGHGLITGLIRYFLAFTRQIENRRLRFLMISEFFSLFIFFLAFTYFFKVIQFVPIKTPDFDFIAGIGDATEGCEPMQVQQGCDILNSGGRTDKQSDMKRWFCN